MTLFFHAHMHGGRNDQLVERGQESEMDQHLYREVTQKHSDEQKQSTELLMSRQRANITGQGTSVSETQFII